MAGAAEVFLTFLAILSGLVIAQPQEEGVASFIQNNATMKIFVLATSLYVGVYIAYEIKNSATSMFIEDKLLLILGHVRFLSGTLAITLLIITLVPCFAWLLIVVWIMFLVKIACFLDKPFYDFEMFKVRFQDIIGKPRDQNAIEEGQNQNTTRDGGQEEP